MIKTILVFVVFLLDVFLFFAISLNYPYSILSDDYTFRQFPRTISSSTPAKRINANTGQPTPNIKKEDEPFAVFETNTQKHVFYHPPMFAMKDYYVPSYYNPRLGVYYPLFPNVTIEEKPETVFFQVGSPIRILISSLANETKERPSEYITSVYDWRNKFMNTKREVFKAFKSKYDLILPLYVSNIKTAIPEHSSEYSTMYYWRNPKTNSQSFFGYNMCFNPMTAEIIFHLPPNEHLNRSRLRGGFFWGWTLKEINSPLIYQRISKKEGVTIVYPPFNNHIYHAVEGMGQVLHKLFSAEEYPYVSHVINAAVRKTDYPWIKDLLNLLMMEYPLDNPTHFYTYDKLAKYPSFDGSPIMCFESVVSDDMLFLDRMRQGGDGGFLSGYLGTDWIRSLVYKKFGIKPKPINQVKYDLLFVHRTNSRRWVHGEQYIKALNNRFGERVVVTECYLKGGPLRDQVNTFYHAKILVSPHGAGLTNAIFMVPHTVVIEVMPPHFTEFCLAGVLLHARLHYIYVSNFDYAALSMNNIQGPDSAYEDGAYMKVRSRYKNLDLTTNVFSILSAVDDGIAFLDHYRDRRVNDFLSPIFV